GLDRRIRHVGLVPEETCRHSAPSAERHGSFSMISTAGSFDCVSVRLFLRSIYLQRTAQPSVSSVRQLLSLDFSQIFDFVRSPPVAGLLGMLSRLTTDGCRRSVRISLSSGAGGCPGHGLTPNSAVRCRILRPID